MDDAKIRAAIKSYLVNNYLPGTNPDTLHDDDSFFEKGIIDSTGVLELVAFVEETFNIMVEDEELMLENLDSLNRLVGFIQLKIEGSNL